MIAPKPQETKAPSNLLDFDLMGGMSDNLVQTPAIPVIQSPVPTIGGSSTLGGFDALEVDLMGKFPPISPQPARSEHISQSLQPSLGNDLLGFDKFSTQPATNITPTTTGGFELDFLGGVTGTVTSPSPLQTPVSTPGGGLDFEFDDFQAPVSAGLVVSAFRDSNIEVKFVSRKDDLSHAKTLIDITFDNLTGQLVGGIDLKISAAKHLTLNSFNPLGIYSLSPGSRDLKTHNLEVVNKEHGSKALAFKLQLTYTVAGVSQTKENVVAGFQSNY